MRKENNIKFTNNEHGILARLWFKFLKEHNIYNNLSARIVKTLNRPGLSKLSEKERNKLSTIKNLAYSSELSIKTFIYLFKELLRGSMLTMNLKLTDMNSKEYISTYKIMLQSQNEKDSDKLLAELWVDFLKNNNLYSNLEEMINEVKNRDMSGLSKEQKNKLKTIGKYAYGEKLSFKSLIFLFKEIMKADTLVLEIILKDAINKDYLSNINIKLSEIKSNEKDKEDE